MSISPPNLRRTRTGLRTSGLVLALAGSMALAACMSMSHAGVARPPAEAFGFGPRTSSTLAYQVTLEPQQPLAVGRLQRVVIRVRDGSGQAVDGATIGIDGGMPEHGHGLPTRPRVTANLGDGAYQVEGLKFNMGGWWQLRFAISGAAGADTVTFNVAL